MIGRESQQGASIDRRGSMRTRLIGVDCATDNARVGLARGWYEDDHLTVEDAFPSSKDEPAATQIARWLADEPPPRTLLALDAPLGRPAQLSQELTAHRAGQPINIDPNDMFRRATDRFIQRNVRKTPLSVGADRIARTAHAALRLLGNLRRISGACIPLAWEPNYSAYPAVIEVYPAATLMSHGFQASGYKAQAQTAEREAIIESFRTVATLPEDVSTLRDNADALDAAICLLAAADFLGGASMGPAPEDRRLAEQEGWIWARGCNVDYLEERAKRGSREKFEAALAKLPDVEPESYDRL
jgi:hypothetical protein